MGGRRNQECCVQTPEWRVSNEVRNLESQTGVLIKDLPCFWKSFPSSSHKFSMSLY